MTKQKKAKTDFFRHDVVAEEIVQEEKKLPETRTKKKEKKSGLIVKVDPEQAQQWF